MYLESEMISRGVRGETDRRVTTTAAILIGLGRQGL